MIYTMEQWAADRAFKAEPGQEVSEEVYNELFNAMPPLHLPRQAAADSGRGIVAGFLMGESHSTNASGKELYLAFGSTHYGKRKYYYLGLYPEEEKTPAGKYYYFDCMNAFITDRLWSVSAFKDRAEAISKAADYEAELIEITIGSTGEVIGRETLYNPFACFDDSQEE